MDETKPWYYAIIPANVRYDKNICMWAKLLYWEISTLCNKEWYCRANNNYFAWIYDVSNDTISRRVKELYIAKYINVEIERSIWNKRVLTLSAKMPIGIGKNTDTPIGKNAEHNNTSNNIKSNKKRISKDIQKKRDEMWLIEEVNKYSSCYPANMLKQFKDYWLEKDQNNKTRLEAEKYFDVSRRLTTRSSKAWIKKTSPQPTPSSSKDIREEMTEEQRKKAKEMLLEMKRNILSKDTKHE